MSSKVCQATVSSKSVSKCVKNEALARLSSKSQSKASSESPVKSVRQECQPRVSRKSVQQECLTRVSSKSVKKECPVKSVQHECLTRVSDKSVRQECLTRVSSKILSRYSARMSRDSIQPVFPIRVSRKRFLSRVSSSIRLLFL